MRELVKTVGYRFVTTLFGDDEKMVPLTIRRGAAKGLKLRLDLIHRKESAYWHGKYDNQILSVLANVIQPGWNCWDCGVYIGLYSCFFGRAVGPNGSVVGFEPDIRNLQRAQRNARLNQLDNVRFKNVAVGGPEGEIEFVLSDNTNSHLPDAWLGSTRDEYQSIERVDKVVRIDCRSLDELLNDETIPSPQLIKIDIEGAELMAFRHMSTLLSMCRPVIVLELHNPECDAAAWRLFESTEYDLFSLDTLKSVKAATDVGGTLLCQPKEKLSAISRG